MRGLHRLLIVALLLNCQTAFSQVSSGLEHYQWEVTAFGGTALEADGDSVEHASGYQAGIRLADHFSTFWAADLEYSFSNQPLRLTNVSTSVPNLSLSQNIHNISYNVSYLPLPPTSRLRPYAKVGAGAALFFIPGGSKSEATAAGLSLNDNWKFVFNWGGGVKYLVADRFAVVFDAKSFISDFPSHGLPIEHDGFLQNWRLNIGFAYQWDD